MTAGRLLVPITMVLSIVSLSAGALTVAFVPDHPRWWTAALHLVVLGGFTPMIYAVNIRIVPVFSRREWSSPRLLRVQIVAAIGGVWLEYVARLTDWRAGEITGQVLSLFAAVLFTVNIVRLFRQPAAKRPAMPLPYEDQARIDRIAIQFTRLSGVYLLVGLVTGALVGIWPPDSGRWDLVWAHSLLVGFFLSMVSGVSYHVLARWTTRRWRSVAAIRVHFVLVAAGLPLMLIALAANWTWLFKIAGPLQAGAVMLFLFNALPLATALPKHSRLAWLAGAAFLLAGVSLGGAFAVDAVLGARLRFAHGEMNLFGWGGLLVSGMAYYLAPRFAGTPLRWPRLATAQIAMLAGGVLIGASAFGARGYGHDADPWLWIAQIAIAASFGLFATIIAATFAARRGAHVQTVELKMTRPAAPKPGTPPGKPFQRCADSGRRFDSRPGVDSRKSPIGRE